MGEVIDATGIQFRMLNVRKGPAMHSPRAQADKKAYQIEVKRRIEHCPNIDLRQELVEDLLTESIDDRSRICGVQVHGDAIYVAKAVILTTVHFYKPSCTPEKPRQPVDAPGRGHRPASAARFDDSASASTASRPAHHQDSMGYHRLLANLRTTWG